MTRTGVEALVVVIALFLLAGCGSAPQELCSGDDDCPECHHCEDGACWLDQDLLNACGQCADEPEEICDDLQDNDCDGETDEGCACQGVVCDTPPGPCHAQTGTCTEGLCDYPMLAAGASCEDGDECTENDQCRVGSCQGSPIVCDIPPDNHCLDTATLRVYTPSGVCVSGICSYGYQDVSCPEGCQEDFCLGDPCAGVVCDDPPGVCHHSSGVCHNGLCHYDHLDGGECDDQDSCTLRDTCTSGLCLGGPMVCDQPPANECIDDMTMRSYAAVGACQDGACTYSYQDVQCTEGCQGGLCLGDPCEGVVCDQPPGQCYLVPGTCAYGVCHYHFFDGMECDDEDPCTDGDLCQSGNCTGQSLSCDDPPANHCLDGETLRSYVPEGECIEGECQYRHHDVNCTFGCQGNYCTGDPCAGVVCDQAPPDECLDADTARIYDQQGICTGGVCSYPFQDETCDDGAWCNGTETCVAGIGCQDGTPPVCIDSVECTDDRCDEGSDACLNTPNHAVCNNGQFCDGAETCDRQLGCQDGTNPCTAPMVCDETDDVCTMCSQGEDCDDDIACTIDHCNDVDGVCQNIPDHASCDDDVWCNGVEFCDSEFGCLSSGNPCSGLGCEEETETCEGSSWGGGISANSGNSSSPCMALDLAGNPVVAWTDNTAGASNIYVKRFDGNSWVEVGAGSASWGGISNSPISSGSCSLALDAAGNPVVAWYDGTMSEYDVYLKKYDGDSWVEVGTGSGSGGGISENGISQYPSLALDGDGNPVVAWSISIPTVSSDIYVKRYDGNSWVEVGIGSASGGGISDNAGISASPRLALDSNGNPLVAWYDHSSGNYEIYLKRYDGNSWVEVGAGSATGGGISADPGDSKYPSLDLDASGNPVVAWYDKTSDNHEIYVKRYNGSSWVEMGAGSASGGGISANPGWSSAPRIDVDTAGNPVVVWYDNTSGNYEIYVKRYEGGSWVEVGAGSASGGGISATPSYSWLGSLALDGAGNPVVTWDDFSPGNYEIYIKRYNGSSWVDIPE